ncbi:hypothetical protein [Salipaludibacillus sp. CF4.18]|uniref:hypothetical protein n=1 Tax=Salipaludibacillus sp. CF4.18 TaxID=3373081 RepID=UPI003EE5A6D2
MERNTIQLFVKKWLLGIMEVIVALPLIIYVWTAFIDHGNMFAWLSVILFMFLAGIVLEWVIPIKRRAMYVFLSVIISFLVAMLLTINMLAFILTGLFVMVMIMRGIVYGREEIGDPFSVYYLLSGFFIYFFAFFFYREMADLAPYQTFLTWSGIILVLFTLFQGNQQYLQEVMLSNERKPYVAKVVRVRNRIAVSILVGLAFLITSAQYIEAFFSRIIVFIASIIPSASEEEVPPPQQDDRSLPDMGIGEETARTSRFFEILETIVTYIVGVIVIIGILFLLIMIYKAFRKHILAMTKWLLAAVTKLGGSSDKKEEELAYVDEKMSIRDWRAWRKENKEKLLDWVSTPFKKELKMDDFPSRREKIRFLYRQSLKTEINNGYQFRKDATPFETLQELQSEERHLADFSEQDLAVVYAKVRYGEVEVSDKEFESIFQKKSSEK